MSSSLNAIGSVDVPSVFRQALSLHQAGQLADAEQLYRKILAAQPQHFDSLHLLGVIHAQRGEHVAALRQIDAALAVNPNVAQAHNNRGASLLALGRHNEALASFERAIALAPDYVDALGNRGDVLRALQRYDEALTSFDRAVALEPNLAPTFLKRGNILSMLGRPEQAIASYDRAIALKGNDADAFNNRGAALRRLARLEEALASCETAIALNPGLAAAFNNRGIVLKDMQRLEEALASYDKAIALEPRGSQALKNRGNVLFELQRFDEALASYERAIAMAPDDALLFHDRGFIFAAMKRFEEAVASFDRAIALGGDIGFASSARLFAKLQACDWTGFDQECATLRAAVANGAASLPGPLLAIPASAALQLTCAKSYVRDKYPARPAMWNGERYSHDRIRLAYVSADFYEHATAHLMAGVFEHHDRSRFETVAISFGPAPDDATRRRMMGAFDRFIDVRALSDQAIASMLCDLEIDIAVDLKGFTQDARTGVFAHRPAPIQVNYLGYPGSMGADYIDYIIADRVVLPESLRAHFSEHVAYLPDSYQANDASRPIAAATPSRAQAGLPEEGFVFCCFNNSFKITPDVFDVWMRLMHAIDDAVLWLFEGNAAAPVNLRREAARRGVVPERLIFAPRTRAEEHLARHRLADLFLDTLHYNAHTTASDALWAGLPVLTCAGATFASRVAASLLSAIGMPELITHSLADYEALAMKLARDRSLLALFRERLARQRESAPLFDTRRFARHIEAAYVGMWERYQCGEPACDFTLASVR
jgi:protein O-GlcNAc transferase